MIYEYYCKLALKTHNLLNHVSELISSESFDRDAITMRV